MTILARLERWWKSDELQLTIECKGKLPKVIPFRAGQKMSCQVLQGGGKGPVRVTISKRYG